MKATWLAVILIGAFFAQASAQDDAATPTPHNKYGYQKKSSVKKTAVSDDETPKPKATPHSTKKKTAKKPAAADEDVPESTPVPTPTPSPEPESTAKKTTRSDNSAPDASLNSDELTEFSKQPEKVQKLLESALALTRLNLTYTYGSADPANGGMDCSGFVYYVLRENGFNDVPRDASGQYVWVRKAKLFQAVMSKKKDSFELDDLRPGDLLFWTGTYAVDKDPPITHAMIYLGTEKETHRAVMVGSTDGRSYNGKSRWGVSVFDFKANVVIPQADPQKQTHALFIGYAHIPGLRPE